MRQQERRLSVSVLALLLMASSTSSSSGAAAEGGQPGTFCVPDGWQSGRAVTRGMWVEGSRSRKPVVTSSLGDVIYSSSLQKLWVDEDTWTSGGVPMTRIYDYPGKVLYTVRGRDGEKNQTCSKTPLLSPFKPLCVPANANMTHYKSYYGATAPYIEYFLEFAGRVTGPGQDDDDVSYRVSLSRDYDTPLFQQQWGRENGERFFQTSEFYNSTIWGRVPANIFDPPHICDNASLATRTPRTSEQGMETRGTFFLL
ncbi:uncharacterized protein LOC143284818 isoform X2 [Babylonia areolata]